MVTFLRIFIDYLSILKLNNAWYQSLRWLIWRKSLFSKKIALEFWKCKNRWFFDYAMITPLNIFFSKKYVAKVLLSSSLIEYKQRTLSSLLHNILKRPLNMTKVGERICCWTFLNRIKAIFYRRFSKKKEKQNDNENNNNVSTFRIAIASKHVFADKNIDNSWFES